MNSFPNLNIGRGIKALFKISNSVNGQREFSLADYVSKADELSLY